MTECSGHHWQIESPNGATSLGRCKRCGAEKRFHNSFDETEAYQKKGRDRWNTSVLRTQYGQ